jgi:predicted DNA-binding transcriptional regulator AlpA
MARGAKIAAGEQRITSSQIASPLNNVSRARFRAQARPPLPYQAVRALAPTFGARSGLRDPKEITMTGKVKDETARAPLEPLLTVEDLERLLRVDRRTIARLCKRGQIPPPLKLGGSNRWRADEIARTLDRGN